MPNFQPLKLHALGLQKPYLVVYLRPADKYHRFTHRLSQGQKGLGERTIWHHGGPLNRVDVLEAGRANARRLLRRPPFAVPHHHVLLTDPLAGATAAPERAALRVASRHGPSVLPPWPVSGDASVWPTPSRASAPAAAAPGVRWHGASRNYGTRDTVPAADASRLP